MNSRIVKSLLLLSLMSVLMIFIKIIFVTKYQGFFLIWNLFLAWIPLFLANLAQKNIASNRLLSCLYIGVWLLFFPNSTYIITDLIHLGVFPDKNLWFDALIIFSTAFSGLLIGLYSLHLIHGVFKLMFTSLQSWFLLFISILASGYGLFLGRFIRFNSWDILTHPVSLFKTSILELNNPLAIQITLAFTFFVSWIYLAFYFLNHTNREPVKSI